MHWSRLPVACRAVLSVELTYSQSYMLGADARRSLTAKQRGGVRRNPAVTGSGRRPGGRHHEDCHRGGRRPGRHPGGRRRAG